MSTNIYSSTRWDILLLCIQYCHSPPLRAFENLENESIVQGSELMEGSEKSIPRKEEHLTIRNGMTATLAQDLFFPLLVRYSIVDHFFVLSNGTARFVSIVYFLFQGNVECPCSSLSTMRVVCYLLVRSDRTADLAIYSSIIYTVPGNRPIAFYRSGPILTCWPAHRFCHDSPFFLRRTMSPPIDNALLRQKW